MTLTRPALLLQRVALVIDYSLSYLGGAQAAFLDQAKALRQFGHEVTIIAPGKPGEAWITEWQGNTLAIDPAGSIPVLQLPIIRNRPKLQKALQQYLEQHLIDVVHLHSEFGLTAAAAAAAQAANIPVVHTVHTFFWETRLGAGIDGIAAKTVSRALKWLTGGNLPVAALAAGKTDAVLRSATLNTAKQAEVVISPSAHQAEKLRAAGAGTVRVIANTSLSEIPAGLPYTEVWPPLRLLWVGRLVPEKRLLEFIKAIKLAVADNPKGSIHVTVVGSGPLEKAAKKQARNLPITFTGRLDRQAVAAQMAASHATVLTSFGFDNQPVIIVESVTAGRPVILCDTKLTEGLSNGSGIYTVDENPETLATLLSELLADRSRLIAASAATLQDREDFNPATHVAKLRSSYQQAAVALKTAASHKNPDTSSTH